MQFKAIFTAVVVAVLLAATALFGIRFKTIEGHELGIKETSSGVEERVYQPGIYWIFPAITTTLYDYDASSQVFTVNDKNTYKVQSAEGQDMAVTLSLRWRIDPKKLVTFHKEVRTDADKKVIFPVVKRVVKDAATTLNAQVAYSGEGLVKLQKSIQDHLTSPDSELAHKGILVEAFVIDHIDLDPAYIAEIKGKQVATQQGLRYAEEEKAATARALRAKAEAQADYNKQVVEADRDAKIATTRAEAQAKQVELQAVAAKKQVVLAAEAERDSALARASGIKALGEAEAEANRLRLASWAVPGAETFARVEVSKQVAQAFNQVTGYLPGVNSINLLTTNFDDSVNALMGKKGRPAANP